MNLNHTECKSRLLPVRDALEVLSGKWKIPIIVALSQGNYRFRELHRQVSGITTRMLSKELKDLELHGLVKRTVYDSLPVSFKYELTTMASPSSRWLMLYINGAPRIGINL